MKTTGNLISINKRQNPAVLGDYHLEIISEDRRILSLIYRDKVAGCLHDDCVCFRQILKKIGSARLPAVDNDPYLFLLRLKRRQ